jgi:prophage antirepressor-like protein
MDIVKAFNTNNLHTEITIKGTHDKPLFRASDIGAVLEMGNIRTSIVDFDSSEKVVQVMDSLGGAQHVTFLTAKGLYKILFRSRKPIAEQFQNWVCDVIEEIRLNGEYKLQQQIERIQEEKQELENKLTEVQEENKLLQIKDTVPMIYIYNTDTRIEKSELKIGYTLNVQTRIRPYKQICKFGKLEFSVEVVNQNVKTVENFIHHMLVSFQIRDEVFRIDVEEAKMLIMRIVNILNLIQIPNDSERQSKLAKTIESEQEIIHNSEKNKISTREMSTQTDFYENVIQPTLLDNDEQTNKFNKFIEEHCVLHNDAEVSVVDIIGQYRILQQSASKEQYNALKFYLDTRFRQSRLKSQEKDQIIHGYIGIRLKEIEYKKSLVVSDEQDFIFHSCLFQPCGKVIFADLMDEYKRWKISLKKEILDDDSEKIKKYLKSTSYVLYTTIWANNTNGQGYYGIMLKKDIFLHKTTSSTGKSVEKRDIKTNHLIATWQTIAKAAESEKIATSKMSRSIKNKTIFNEDYYYCLKK